jgi:hypothetical protein
MGNKINNRKYLFVVLFAIIVATNEYSEGNQIMNNWTDINNLSTLAAGSLIVIESGLLLYGMNFPNISEWTGIKNNGIAISDIILGGLLVYYSLSSRNYTKDVWYYLVISSLSLTHGYREYEYLKGTTNSFTANIPLFILNNVRIGLIGASLGLNIKIAL